MSNKLRRLAARSFAHMAGSMLCSFRKLPSQRLGPMVSRPCDFFAFTYLLANIFFVQYRGAVFGVSLQIGGSLEMRCLHDAAGDSRHEVCIQKLSFGVRNSNFKA